jgi:2-oxoglutarate ferredoxin oxidoreductase subunit delta
LEEETMDETAALDTAEKPAAEIPSEERESKAAPKKRKKPRAPGRRYVYKRWCKACGICIAFCPENVFEIGEDGRAEVVRPENCTNCQICDRLCPDFAITLTPWEDKYGELFTPTSLGQDKAEGSRESVV